MIAYAKLREMYPSYPELYRRGLNRHQIAAELQISPRLWWRLHAAFGFDKIVTKRVRRRGISLNDPQYKALPSLVEKGLTCAQIQEALNITMSEAYRLARHYGITGDSVAFPAFKPPTFRNVAQAEVSEHHRSHVSICETSARPEKRGWGGPQKRDESGLTAWNRELIRKCPDILDPLVVPKHIQVCTAPTVIAIRKALGIYLSAGPVPLKDRVLSVIDRPMKAADVAAAIAPRETDIVDALCRYAASGDIKRLSRGVYAPANWPEKDLP